MPQRRFASAATSSPSDDEPIVRTKQQHLRHSFSPSSSSSSPPCTSTAAKSHGNARAFPVHNPRPRDNNNNNKNTKTPTTRSTASPHHHSENATEPNPKSEQKKPAPPPLRTRDILRNPRLQQVTGIFPGKADLWSDRELPPDELHRLAWAMTLPSPFPFKRPRGERRAPIAQGIKRI